jgi:hypothetical protein
MELLLVSSEDPEKDRTNWDIDVVDGVATVVPEGAEEDQEASVVAYLEKNTIPLMEDRGVDWTGYLTKRASLAEIDTQIRENLKTYLDNVMFTPTYSPVEGKLVVNMAKLVINTGA